MWNARAASSRISQWMIDYTIVSIPLIRTGPNIKWLLDFHLTFLDSVAKEEDESKYDVNEYLKDIPVDIKEQLEAHGQIAEALFNVGLFLRRVFKINQVRLSRLHE